jgi:hypothetical protein
LIEELGSIARTATFLPLEIANLPKFSIKVDFPAPGTPVTPIRIEFGKRHYFFQNSSACILCSDFLLSTNVIAFAIRRLFPDRIPSTSSSVENFIDSKIIIKQ